MSKQNLSKILMLLGIVPFVVVLFTAIYSAIMGFGGLSLNTPLYGLDAFFEWIILYSYGYWYTYVIGIMFIVISIVLNRTDR